jgi:hypothetical protein
MLTDAELVAEQVLVALGIKRVPVDVLDIARRERIELCPIEADSTFCGRLEFVSHVNRFLLFYPRSASSEGRLRFSIAHELGHYYLPRHHEKLRAGGAPHSSNAGFLCEKALEREADDFAAGLLIPKPELEARLRIREFMTLREIVNLANDCRSSLESAAIRYAKFTPDRCIVVISRFGKISYSVASDEACRFWKPPPKETPLPASSLSAAAPSNYGDGRVTEIQDWSPGSYFRGEVWEEAISLGYGTTITLLALQAKSSR